ncbi:hypothetical protein [Phenylobacterium deserti]|uniref:Uncharacterized protein n=1 Tax=Phenylobacterium deserti TaxID=1914756 RepID=A0A328AV03_9CAUL|nr:hypothetical protein [Phenylobacterium deserti]RAK57384.1 hypothetical protein DJ018_05445 [Phenylobacterium deserti]
MNPYVLTPWISWTLFVLVVAGAILRGGLEERLAAGALMLSLALSIIFRDPTYSGLQWGAFAGDLVLLGVLLFLVLRSARFWPIWAAGFQLLGVLTHLGRVLDPKVQPWAYASAQVIWTWALTVAVGVGVLAKWRERQTASALTPAAATRR